MKGKNSLSGWGVNVVVRSLSDSTIVTLMDHIQKLRFGWIRYEFDLRNPVDSKQERKFFQRLKKRGISVYGLVHQSVSGNFLNILIPGMFHRSVYEKQRQLVEFLESKALVHKDLVANWEILNEPNTKRFWIRKPNHLEYLEVLHKAAVLLKKVNPLNRIVLGGICGDDLSKITPTQQTGFLMQLAKSNANRWFDVANFHPYGLECYISNKSAEEYWDVLLRRLKGIVRYSALWSGNKPLVISEYGISPRWVKLSTLEIAKLYLKLYRWLNSRNIPLAIWSLTEDAKRRIEPFSPEKYFYLLDNQFKITPLYRALAKEVAAYD